MALSQNNTAYASDYNSVKTAITNAYTKIKGSSPSWSADATVTKGTTITAAAINALNTIGSSAASSWATGTTQNSAYNSNSACGQNYYNVSTGSFSKAYRYWSKCGGKSLIILRF